MSIPLRMAGGEEFLPAQDDPGKIGCKKAFLYLELSPVVKKSYDKPAY